ncbi:hypothetical protein [Bacillus pinisoli]|uniref:hypothetical protein n=1 Tax=Bacillus pinisoli TaxID=2901866 RepID=UPI001FF63D65|nr:hypothetical protein [Bacillus pinisoli]
MKIGEIVVYNDKLYKIVFIYDSGNVELYPLEALDGRFAKVILARLDDVKKQN